MSVLVLLIIVSVAVAGGFLVAFLWSVKSGQMEDDYTPSVRMLFDDEITIPVSPIIKVLDQEKLKSQEKVISQKK
jgi:cbb3-type cytochrome oxidase maturation protein